MNQVEIKTSGALAMSVERLGDNMRAVRLVCRQLAVSIAAKSIISDFTQQFEGGQLVHVSGPNGSGKSTLLGVLSGLLSPGAGSCQWFVGGHEFDLGADLIYVPQYPIIFHGMTVEENLSLISHTPLREIEGALKRLIEGGGPRRTVSLIENFKEPTARLSTGQQRALLVVAASLSSVPAILLDEPYAGLADDVANECKNEIKNWASVGKLVMVVEPGNSF
jgi:ABC-type multidrug transport system ATPase subunit